MPDRVTNLAANVRGHARRIPTLAGKTSDQTKSSTTFGDDADLVLPVEANAIYRLDIWLHFSGNDNIGIKVKLLAPSGTSYAWVSPTDMGGGNINLTEMHSSTEIDAMTWSASHRGLRLAGNLNTGGTAGDCQLQWAAWNSGSITLYAGSWMELRRCD